MLVSRTLVMIEGGARLQEAPGRSCEGQVRVVLALNFVTCQSVSGRDLRRASGPH